MNSHKFPIISLPFMGQFILPAAITMSTGNNNIFRRIRTSPIKGYYVINREILANLLTTPITLTLLGIIKAFHIFIRIFTTCLLFGAILIGFGFHLSRIVLSPFSMIGTGAIRMSIYVFALVFQFAFWVYLSPMMFIVSCPFQMIVSPITGIGTFFFPMFFVVLAPIFITFIFVGFLPYLIFLAFTLAALSTQPQFIHGAKEFFSLRVFNTADCTTFHSNFVLYGPEDWGVGSGIQGLPFRRVIRPSYAYKSIITQEGN